MKKVSSEPQFRVERMIGSGAFGHVFEVVDLATNRRVALKRMLKTSKNISREYEILRLLQGSENVLQLEDFFYSLNFKGELIQNFVFEYCQGNLEEVLESHTKGRTKLDYKTIKRIAFNLVKGLRQLHANNVCHRDFKPENVLVKDGDVKIADMGSAKVLLGANSPYVVSRFYRAPELILGVSEYTLSIDMWSLGVALFEFLFKKLPFKGNTEGHHLIMIIKGLGVPPEDVQKAYRKKLGNYYCKSFDYLWTIKTEELVWANLDGLRVSEHERRELRKFLEQCWDYDFERRIDAVKAYDLPFFDDVRNSDIKLNLLKDR